MLKYACNISKKLLNNLFVPQKTQDKHKTTFKKILQKGVKALAQYKIFNSFSSLNMSFATDTSQDSEGNENGCFDISGYHINHSKKD